MQMVKIIFQMVLSSYFLVKVLLYLYYDEPIGETTLSAIISNRDTNYLHVSVIIPPANIGFHRYIKIPTLP